jgi:hypothetical protein
MSTIINATTTNGVVIQPDNSGSLVLQTNSGTTALTIDTSQRAAFVAGTAALPAITTTGDTNTGIFFPAADTIAFAEGGAESMRIDSSGNVGIGISSPSKRLEVSSNDAQTDLMVSRASNGLGTILRWDNTAGHSYLYNNGAYPLLFGTNNTERMRIDTSGNVLLNGTSFASVDQNAVLVGSATGRIIYQHLTGTTTGTQYLNFQYAGTGIGSITQSGTTAVLYNTTSDYRLKTNAVLIDNALSKINALNPVSFTWIDGRHDDGFLAHEIQTIIPNCVTGEKDAVDEEGKPIYQQMDNSGVIPFLVKAIQEQQTIINDLKARITALEGAA